MATIADHVDRPRHMGSGAVERRQVLCVIPQPPRGEHEGLLGRGPKSLYVIAVRDHACRGKRATFAFQVSEDRARRRNDQIGGAHTFPQSGAVAVPGGRGLGAEHGAPP